MDIVDKEIPDVKIFTPRVFEDARGYFTQTYTRNQFDIHVPGLNFVQDNESCSREVYTVRGLHYQAPPFAQDKLIRVLRGRIFDVAVDVRKGSPHYGHWVSEELSAENRKQLFAPKGFLHGFITLEADTVVAYKVTNFFDGPSDRAVFWASDSLGIPWPVAPDQAILSDKDAAATPFDDFNSPF